MSSSNNFYSGGLGDRLADPSYHPEEIVAFLQEERRIINSIQPSIDLLIEVGCMEGRYLDWAIAYKKLYIGVDIVERYIQAGRRTVAKHGLPGEAYQFIVGNAEEIARLIDLQHLPIKRDRCLLLFPFNSFGNMENAEKVVVSLKESEMPFLISSYQTTKKATNCRNELYTRCGFKDVRWVSTEEGICFSSSDGLCSIAHHPGYLQKLCKDHNLHVQVKRTQPINVFYTSLLIR